MVSAVEVGVGSVLERSVGGHRHRSVQGSVGQEGGERSAVGVGIVGQEAVGRGQNGERSAFRGNVRFGDRHRRRVGGGNRDPVVLYFPVGGTAGGQKTAETTQPEAGVGASLFCPGGHAERNPAVALGDCPAAGNLFAVVGPIPVAVEVDPGVQLGAGGGILHVDRYGGAELPNHDRGAKDNAVFVVTAVGVIPVRRHGRLAVGLRVSIRAEAGAAGGVVWAVIRSQRRIRARGISEVIFVSDSSEDLGHGPSFRPADPHREHPPIFQRLQQEPPRTVASEPIV